MKALITGIPGFAGSHLACELIENGYQVYGTHLPGENLSRLDQFESSLKLYSLDLNKPEGIPGLLQSIKPDYIFHLAAMPAVGKSFDIPEMTYKINFLGSFHMLEAARKLKKIKGFLMVTSSDVYGVVKPRELPLNTDHRLAPVSPYAVSKAAADMLAYQYFKNYELPVVRVRSFNHSGPGQIPGFLIPDICSQIARIENSRRKPVLKVGNLTARRDISDVRDIVCGYRLALERGRPGDVYHLCTGKAYSIKTILNKLVRMAHIHIGVKTDPKLARPTEVPVLIGDASKAEKKLGYKRKFSIDDTLKDCLEYYRSLQGGLSGRTRK